MPESTNAHTASAETAHFDALAPLFVHLHSGYLIRTAWELGLADQIDDTGTTVDALADRAGAHPEGLRRLLRALSALGIFRPAGDDTFAHNAVSAMLRSGPGSSPTMDTFVHSEWATKMWEALPEAIRTGKPAFPEVMGKPFYDYLNEDDPESAASFNAAMTQAIGSSNQAIVAALDLRSSTELVDVGGGQGTLLRDLLRSNSHVHGTLFDIGHALVDVDPELRSGALSQRCAIVEGDARTAVPEGADAYVFRTVLHNWDDESCVQMLRSCARNARSGARVFVVEVALPEDGPPSEIAGMLDMQMFMLFGSSERAPSEYAALFERAGLEYVGVTDTTTQFGVIEARVP